MTEVVNSNSSWQPSKLNHKLLDRAWKIYDVYDLSAVKVQKRVTFLRLLILRLSIFVTLLAVLNSQFQATRFDIDILSYLGNILNTSVIIAPIAVSILLAGAVKFDRGVSWILLRGSAETIKQEIYRYRTQVGEYRKLETRDSNFAREIQTISERLMKTQVNQGGLYWDGAQPNQKSPLLIIVYRRIGNIIQTPLTNFTHQLSRLVKWILRIPESSENSDNNYPQDTDRFSVLSAAEYIDLRLMDQMLWYRRKTLALDKKWQWWQWWIYILGGIGTYLAASKLDVWIAVTNSISASILSFLDFRQFDSTLVSYNQTATNLENILCWWHALTPEAQAEEINVEKLVQSSEQVIHSETTGWVQEMRDALTTLYEEQISSEQTDETTDITST
ncbi:MAG: DUF4231 domain-containing protein [Crocosphaera sp.]|nr:DUF4231 domain-containing protein [Crocosphaera sp.]